VDLVLNNFAVHRLMWGSDWPVALLAASYPDTFGRVTATLDRLVPDERAAVLGGNAQRIYRID
jgi:L-fuconolactonase